MGSFRILLFPAFPAQFALSLMGGRLHIENRGGAHPLAPPVCLQALECVEGPKETPLERGLVPRELGERLAIGHECRGERFLIARRFRLGGAGQRGRVLRWLGDGRGEHFAALFGEQQRRRALERTGRAAGVTRPSVQRLIRKHAGLDPRDARETPCAHRDALDELFFDRAQGCEVLIQRIAMGIPESGIFVWERDALGTQPVLDGVAGRGRLTAAVFGPVERCAFRWLASRWAIEVIVFSTFCVPARVVARTGRIPGGAWAPPAVC